MRKILVHGSPKCTQPLYTLHATYLYAYIHIHIFYTSIYICVLCRYICGNRSNHSYTAVPETTMPFRQGLVASGTCIHVYTYTYRYVYIHMHTSIHMYRDVCIYMCMYVYIYISILMAHRIEMVITEICKPIKFSASEVHESQRSAWLLRLSEASSAARQYTYQGKLFDLKGPLMYPFWGLVWNEV